MPVFLIIIILFFIWFRVKLKQSAPTSSDTDDTYWEREQNANFTRKQDISSLDYLVVSTDSLPFLSPDTAADNTEEALLEQEVKECMQRKMINLSDFSNTDLKEKFGFANLEELSNCEQNFTHFLRALAKWGVFLYNKRDFLRSQQIMEYSLSIDSDISTVYTTLGKIYAQTNPARLDELIQLADSSNLPKKSSVLKELWLCKLEY